MTITLLIQALALVLLLLAGINVPTPPRVSFGWLGLFLWFLSTLIKL